MILLKQSRWIVCLLTCLTFTIVFISCSDDDPQSSSGEATSEEAITRFKSYLYLPDGEINANQLSFFEPTEWAVSTESPERPLEVFSEITGLSAPLKDIYEYSYVSSDKKCSIRILGSSTPNAEGKYATMYIQIEGYEEISELHICTPDYFNEGGEDTMGNTASNPESPGVPVKW